MSKAQPYRLTPPLNADQIEKLDEMLQILFESVAANSGVNVASNAASGLTAAQVAARVSVRL